MTRYGSVLRLQPASIETYKRYHAQVWLEALATIRKCNIRNDSIYLKDDLLAGRVVGIDGKSVPPGLN